MCLDKLKDFKVKQTEGYKVFVIDKKGAIHSRFQRTHIRFKVNRWIRAKKSGEYTDLSEPYTTGFHIFLRKEDALKWHGNTIYHYATIIKKVKFKGIVAKGVEDSAEIIVASEMLILPDVKRRKKAVRWLW